VSRPIIGERGGEVIIFSRSMRLVVSILIALTLLAGGTFLIFKFFGDTDLVTENQLALGQETVERDEEGVLEVEDARIVMEDDEVVSTEINLDDYHFALSIKTDDLSVATPVVDGVSNSSLSRGVGRHVSTAIPNAESGNVVLSGHQWFPGSRPAHKVFENLDKLEVGQEVEIKYGAELYRYKVRESKIVEPTDVSILEHTDSPQLTLYTCFPRYTTEKRLVYVADLVEVTKIDS
jgi:sortase A